MLIRKKEHQIIVTSISVGQIMAGRYTFFAIAFCLIFFNLYYPFKISRVKPMAVLPVNGIPRFAIVDVIGKI
jgi:hypothetical protein